MVAAEEHGSDEGSGEVGLRIASSWSDGWSIVSFHGELDLEQEVEAREALERAAAADGDGVMVNLRAVTFLGSTGVRLLLDAHAATADAGRRLRVVQGRGPARRLIELLDLSDRLDVVDRGE